MPMLLQAIRAFLNRSSHLSPYIPLARQDPDQKSSRLIADKSVYQYPAKVHVIPGAKTLQTFQFQSTATSVCMNPMNGWLLLWYAVVFLGIIYFFSETTIILAYGDVAWQAALSSPTLVTLDVFFILVFIGDIYIQLNTGYITNSAIILDRLRVKDRYTHYYFYFDILLIAVLAVSVIIRVQLFNYAKLIIFYKFMRMFEFNQIYLRRLAINVVARTAFQISKQFITIFVLSHIIGLIFYVIDFALTNDPICEGDNQSFCWLYSATAYSPIIQLDWTLQYFYSLYWGVNTMCQISYGDIAPNNPVETPYAVFCMCFGSIVYTYIVNSIVKAIIWANQKRDQFRVDLVTFDKYMEQLKIKRQDQYEITNFLKERFREAPNRNLMLEDLMKGKLPEDMKIELVRNAYSHIVQGLEYFIGEGMPVNNILFSIREKKYGHNEQIITQGSPLDELCFMINGQVVLSCQFHQLKYGICTLNMPDTFIAAYEFFLSQRSSYSVVSKQNTAFYFIPRQIINQQIQEDLDFKQTVHLLSYDLLVRKKLERIFYNCFFCGKMHQWHQCEDVLPNFKGVTLLKSKIKRQEEGVRVVNTKHRTWKDYQKLKELDRIVRRNKDKVLSQLQKRIFALKKRLEAYEEMFEVDAAYNWPKYLNDENINRFKEDWNRKLTNRRSSINAFNHSN